MTFSKKALIFYVSMCFKKIVFIRKFANSSINFTTTLTGKSVKNYRYRKTEPNAVSVFALNKVEMN